MTSIVTWLRQRFCAHRCYIEDIELSLSPTDLDKRVKCPCSRCGRVLFASYGIALPAATLERKPEP